MVEGHKQQRTAVMVARAMVTPTGTSIPLRLLNWRNEPVSISKGTTIADLEPVLGADISTETVASVCTDSMEVPAEQCLRLWEMVSKSGDRLTQALCLEYTDLFATGSDDFGRTTTLKHKIYTKSSPPIRQQARRIPPFRKDEVKRLLDEMLRKGVITSSKSLGIPCCSGPKERWFDQFLCGLS